MSQPDIFHDKKERNDFYIALGVIALFAFFLWYFIFGTKAPVEIEMSDLTTSEQIEDEQAEPIIYESDIDFDEEDEEEEAPEQPSKSKDYKVSEVDPPMTKDKSDMANSIASTQEVGVEIPELDEVAEQAKEKVSEVQEVLTEEVPDKVEDLVESVSEQVEEVTSVVAEKVEATTEVVSEKVEEAVKQLPVVPAVSSSGNSDACHISVGLYKEAANIAKMRSRLEQSGFDTYTTQAGRYTQIGVYVTCERNEATSILSEIQSDFAKDAFIEEFR